MDGRLRKTWPWAVWLLGGTWACTSASPSESVAGPCEPHDEATLEIGDGEDTYAPAEGREIALVYGPQGGYHILVSLKATGLDSSQRTEVRLTGTVDDDELADVAPRVTFRCESGESLIASRVPLVWDAEPQELHGRAATLHAELERDEGDLVEAWAEIVLLDPRASDGRNPES